MIALVVMLLIITRDGPKPNPLDPNIAGTGDGGGGVFRILTLMQIWISQMGPITMMDQIKTPESKAP